MRIFTRMRKLLLSRSDLLLKVEKLDQGLKGQASNIELLFKYVQKLINDQEIKESQNERPKIGYKRSKA